eukprot:g6501.t1
MHVQTGPAVVAAGLEDKPNAHSFASYLVERAGYTAAWFGKHLNVCPHEPPPGFACPTCRWFANGGASDTEPGGYLQATFSDFVGGKPSNNTYARNGTYWSWLPGAPTIDGGRLKQPQHGGYWTAIVANKSIEWLREVAGPPATRDPQDPAFLRVPFVLTVAPKAPHYAATPAPWYEGPNKTWIDQEGIRAPRVENFGVDPNRLRGHHAQIAAQGPLLPHEVASVDRQYRKRWVALLSVDDAIEGVVNTIDELGLANSTYIFVTSDHGYNMGNHNLPSCKLQVYDHSIRVPMLMRGPGIAPRPRQRGQQRQFFTEIGCNADLAPTFLALAGLDPSKLNDGNSTTPPPMDGKSLLPWLLEGAGEGSVAQATWAQLQFTALEGMRCGAGHAPGTLPGLNTTADPGHLVDHEASNNYRALRFVDPDGRGNMLYAEFTRFTDSYHFTDAEALFVEVFNLDKDPGQLVNLANVTPPEDLAYFREAVRRQFGCAGLNYRSR